jgi:4-amino-4-deoxychorismate lyase
VKSCNYLEKIIAKDEAKQRGFDEAIQLNERGDVASACMANVFWRRSGKLFTPSLETGCLPGTTREFVLENIDCDEVALGIEELRTADEIFLTSAGLGVVQVAEFDGRKVQRNEHAIMKLVPSRQ